MARKIKIKPRHNQPGLFDLTNDLFADTDSARLEREVGDEIVADFVVNIDPKRSEPRPERLADEDMTVAADAITVPDTLLFISFGSGSSGNSSYVGTRDEGVLIDAGIDPEKIRETLNANGISLSAIKGVCLTHDHSDHVRFAYNFVRKHPDTGIYCTPKTLSGMLRRHSISRRIKDYHRPIFKEFPFNVAGLELTAFEVSHDGSDNSGYFITRSGVSMAIATDLGSITPRVDYYMRQARHIMIEANYDAKMLREGPYSMYLKARIAAPNGHLDNAETGRFLAEIFSPKLRNVFLCHLSQDNNTPDTAVATVSRALRDAGCSDIGDGSGTIEMRSRRIQLVALPRFDASAMYVLRAD